MMLSDGEKLARLQKALDHAGNSHSVSDIAQLVRAGNAQWWESGDGNIVTELVSYPQFRSVRYWLISGCLADCLALDQRISTWAVEQDCIMAEASGRRGWGRAAKHLGWKHHGYTFYKDLVR